MVGPRRGFVAYDLAFDRDRRGELRAAWIALAGGDAIGLVSGGADYPLWGSSDRVVGASLAGVLTPLW